MTSEEFDEVYEESKCNGSRDAIIAYLLEQRKVLRAQLTALGYTPQTNGDMERIAACDKTHEGFRIVCCDCSSPMVVIESSMGFSPQSGSWGSVDLVCTSCGNRRAVYE